jgi:MFS family permease
MTAPASASLGPDYRKLWSAAAASNLADGVIFVALPLIAVSLTSSPALVAGVAIAGRLPWLVFVLFAGALADRLDRRITMRNVQLMRVVVVGLLAVLALSDQLSIALLYVVAFVLGVGETLFDTSAQSIMPSIVRKDLLSRANGRLHAVELTMNAFVGPPVGGFLVAISFPLALGGSVLGYALAAAGLALIVGSFRATSAAPRASMLREIREGFEYVWHDRVLRTMAIMVGTLNLSGSAVLAVLVLFAVAPGPMGLDELGYGLLMTAFAVGGVIGSLLEERVERWIGRSRVLWLTVWTIGLATLVPALTSHALLVAVSLVATGGAGMMWNVITVSLRQRITPDHLLGRMNATYRLFAWGVMPIGALLGGLVAEELGLRALFAAAAAVVFVTLVFRRHLTEAALEAAESRIGGPPAGAADADAG